MKIKTKLGILSAVGVLVFAGVSFGASANDDLPESHLEHIRQNCISSKNTLSQLHASDALLRVNTGQLYESMSTRLMVRFNSRAAANGLDTTKLTVASDGFNLALDAYRSSYRVYEEQVSNTLKIDCLNRPADFYSSVTSARSKRSQVNADVTRLNHYISEYERAVIDIESGLKPGGEVSS